MGFPFLKAFFITLAVLAIVGVVAIVFYVVALVVALNHGDGVTWNQWIEDHCKTCQQCDKAFNHLDESDGGMCETAFNKMREFARREKQR